jgi:hypothetical protein
MLPVRRNERDASRRLRAARAAAPTGRRSAHPAASAGWQVQPQATWVATLGLLDPKRRAARQPVLPATLDTEAEAMLFRRPGSQSDTIHVLRIWRAPALLDNGQPLWIGGTQTLHYIRPIPAFGLWMPEPDDGAAHVQLRAALIDLEHTDLELAEAPHPDGDLPVIRLRSDQRPARSD